MKLVIHECIIYIHVISQRFSFRKCYSNNSKLFGNYFQQWINTHLSFVDVGKCNSVLLEDGGASRHRGLR